MSEEKALWLVRLRDLYFVVEGTKPKDCHDYSIHSRKCLVNIMGWDKTIEVFCREGRDPHGQIRFIASIPDTKENRGRFHFESNNQVWTLTELFKLFSTDGSEIPTNYPIEEAVIIDAIEALLDELEINHAWQKEKMVPFIKYIQERIEKE